MKIIANSAMVIAIASRGNPIIALIVVIFYYEVFAQIEMLIETLIWGKCFEHILDVGFILMFAVYSGYVVLSCAKVN